MSILHVFTSAVIKVSGGRGYYGFGALFFFACKVCDFSISIWGIWGRTVHLILLLIYISQKSCLTRVNVCVQTKIGLLWVEGMRILTSQKTKALL